MAKAAKQNDPMISDKDANRAIASILDRYENIESARGKFMNLARRERDGMVATYEAMAAKGVSQKTTKTHIKIIRAIEKIKGWQADLEAAEARMLKRLAKAHGDKAQLSLMLDAPKVAAAKEPRTTSTDTNTDTLSQAAPQGSA